MSVEGFGMEWWDWERRFGPVRPQRFQFNTAVLPPVHSNKMLRRMAELATMNAEEDQAVDEHDLHEFLGDAA